MTDKKKTNKRKLSTLVKQQVPEFVLSEHPKFTEFLSSYFLFMESAELNLESITDIDNIVLESATTVSNFVSQLVITQNPRLYNFLRNILNPSSFNKFW